MCIDGVLLSLQGATDREHGRRFPERHAAGRDAARTKRLLAEERVQDKGQRTDDEQQQEQRHGDDVIGEVLQRLPERESIQSNDFALNMSTSAICFQPLLVCISGPPSVCIRVEMV